MRLLMSQVWKFIQTVSTQLLELFKKAHYHEYPILDDHGEIIGYEIVTTRGGYTRLTNSETGEKENE